MRQWMAERLHQLAGHIFNDQHRQRIEILDEYEICRCTVEVDGDSYGHGLTRIADILPTGWTWRAYEDDKHWP